MFLVCNLSESGIGRKGKTGLRTFSVIPLSLLSNPGRRDIRESARKWKVIVKNIPTIGTFEGILHQKVKSTHVDSVKVILSLLEISSPNHCLPPCYCLKLTSSFLNGNLNDL